MSEVLEETARQLREGLAAAAAPLQPSPGLRSRVECRRRRRVRRRRRALGGAAVAAVAVVAALGAAVAWPSGRGTPVATGPASPSPSSTVAAPPGGASAAAPSWWLPKAGTVSAVTVGVGSTAPAFEQLYVGSAVTDPPVLAVASIDTRAGKSGSGLIPPPSGFQSGVRTVKFGAVTAHLATMGDLVQLWWTRSDGVTVVANEIGLAPARVEAVMATATPAGGRNLGIRLHEPLPAGLTLARSARTSHTAGWLEQVDLAGSCPGTLDIFQGTPLLITGTRISIDGRVALLEAASGGVTTLDWAPAAGVTAELITHGRRCDPVGFARSLTATTPAAWAAERAKLGSHFTVLDQGTATTSPAPTLPPTSPAFQLVLARPGPHQTTIRLATGHEAASDGHLAQTCLLVTMSNPGIASFPGKPPWQDLNVCEQTNAFTNPANNPLWQVTGNIWRGPDHTLYWIAAGWAEGATTVRFSFPDGHHFTVPVVHGWYLADMTEHNYQAGYTETSLKAHGQVITTAYQPPQTPGTGG